MIVALPAAIAVTTPVTELTVAAAVLLLLQLPPPLPVLVNAVVEPTQMDAAPLTTPEFGRLLIVTFLEAVAIPQELETV